MAGGTAHSWNVWPNALTNSRGNGGRRGEGIALASEGIGGCKGRWRSGSWNGRVSGRTQASRAGPLLALGRHTPTGVRSRARRKGGAPPTGDGGRVDPSAQAPASLTDGIVSSQGSRQGVPDRCLLLGGEVHDASAGLLVLRDPGDRVTLDKAQAQGPFEQTAESIPVAVHSGPAQGSARGGLSALKSREYALDDRRGDLVQLVRSELLHEPAQLDAGGWLRPPRLTLPLPRSMRRRRSARNATEWCQACHSGPSDDSDFMRPRPHPRF
jgi:hypothetical protein